MIYLSTHITLGLIAAYLATLNHRSVSFEDVIICILAGPIGFISEVIKPCKNQDQPSTH